LNPGDTTSVSLSELGAPLPEASRWNVGDVFDVAAIIGYKERYDSPIVWVDELKIDDAIKIT